MLQPIKKLPRGITPPRFFQKMIVLLVIIILLLIFLPLFPYFLIIDGESEAVLYKTPIEIDEQFSIRFIHSINLTPVEEHYRVTKDYNLHLYELYFETYSVGMESDLNKGESLELKDGIIIIQNINRIFPYLDLRVPQIVKNHTITINNEVLDLTKVASPGAYIRVKAEKLSILEILGVL